MPIRTTRCHRTSARHAATRPVLTAAAASGVLVAGGASAQEPPLSAYFGFDAARVVVIDDNAGPMLVYDMNGDGLNDLIIANNRKSRIEVHLQRREPRTDEDFARDAKVNELPPNPWFDRNDISVSHAIRALRVHDIDADGRPDLVYAGNPAEIVVLHQAEPMTFEVAGRRRVRDFSGGASGILIADLMGDTGPEIALVATGRVEVYPLTLDGPVGEPVRLAEGGEIVAIFSGDFDGNGATDLLAAEPSADTPLRLYLQQRPVPTAVGRLTAELRFEMPPIVEIQPVKLPGRQAELISVIERQSRRIVFYELQTGEIEVGGSVTERDALAEVYVFPGGRDRERSVVAADINLDGMLDLLATDKAGNGVSLHVQRRGTGLDAGERFSAFKEPVGIDAGQWDGRGPLEVFVLSEEERTVGVASIDSATGALRFPRPIPLVNRSATPVAMSFFDSPQGPALAVVVRDRRDHTLEIHRPDAEPVTLALEGVNRPPKSVLAGDFIPDGKPDLALFTPGEPMVLVAGIDLAAADDQQTPIAEVLTDKDMAQFGLVQSAGPNNTAIYDLDGDGLDELLIADANFVRAARIDPDAGGWIVVDQVTAPDPRTSFSALAVLPGEGNTIIAGVDNADDRILLMTRNDRGRWGVSQSLRLTGINASGLFAGAFTGSDEPSLVAVGDDGFGLIRLGGERVTLEPAIVYRADNEDRLEHDIEIGDLNSDGYADMAVLDAREQMCQLFTFSASGKLHDVMEFRVFETRLFDQGGGAMFEPSTSIIRDITGDNQHDLVLLVHDRVLIYPQATRETSTAPGGTRR